MSTTSDDWSLKEYHPPESKERWFFRKNLEPSPKPGKSAFPYIAYVTLHFDPRDESGLPSTEVEALLYQIEDNELEAVESAGRAIHVASVLKAGVKDLLFYSSDPDAFLEQVAELRSMYPRFAIECEIHEDPQWEHHRDFP